MNKKFSKKELLKTAESGLSDMSCEQIKALIKKESEKNYEDINTDYIDLCFDALVTKHNNEALPAANIINTKKSAVRKALLFAAVFMIFTVTTLTVSASVFRFNIPEEIAIFISGNAEIAYNLESADTVADEYTLSDTDLAKELADYGISPVTFPEELIKENCKITNIKNLTTDEHFSTDITIEFEYLNCNGSIDIIQYCKDFENAGVNTVMDITSGQTLNINGIDVFIFEKEDSCTIKYRNNLTSYSIYIDCDLETAIKLAETIK